MAGNCRPSCVVDACLALSLFWSELGRSHIRTRSSSRCFLLLGIPTSVDGFTFTCLATWNTLIFLRFDIYLHVRLFFGAFRDASDALSHFLRPFWYKWYIVCVPEGVHVQVVAYCCLCRLRCGHRRNICSMTSTKKMGDNVTLNDAPAHLKVLDK